jgi:hypothetical protein
MSGNDGETPRNSVPNLAKVGVEGSNPFARSNSLLQTSMAAQCGTFAPLHLQRGTRAPHHLQTLSACRSCRSRCKWVRWMSLASGPSTVVNTSQAP